MTFDQSPHATLTEIIRQARHLLFSFGGSIRRLETGFPAPHMQDALVACSESGRSAVVISTSPAAKVRAYLDEHELSPQITLVAPSISEAVSALEASPGDCVVVTSSPSDIEAAKAAGVPAIAYARIPDDAEHLVHAGASTFMYSMMDLALRLRSLCWSY
jgi:beta-phosphoglucomutase-like phosphatase (HAD superfamily)